MFNIKHKLMSLLNAERSFSKASFQDELENAEKRREKIKYEIFDYVKVLEKQLAIHKKALEMSCETVKDACATLYQAEGKQPWKEYYLEKAEKELEIK